ncbi:hypothetical protein DP73_03900 [Desulfosporosinus sp. HMP52]|uniref:nucleotidyltransferase domain-containing protein n=1 Tax=Desulfosporosinus sp. HMP52 TaxID=1487923 RepID=UPI00051F9B59|nr:nucleotidyltransferase family protein [Desulfosporosinus sp. HMP52]KGK91414.1 hypothetical protein DP73_03900 [Desulfosporosinus sp. HMP52]
MNTTQQQLLYITKQVIHDQVPAAGSFSAIDSQGLYDLALRQNVCALVYPMLENYPEVIKLDEEIMDKWRTTSLYIITHQIRKINGLKIAWELLKANDVMAISVKGIAIREVYPQPELRNMGDVDLLIHEQDMQKSIDLLSTLGYQANLMNMKDPEYMHIAMYKKDSFPIELHRTLWHPKHMKKINNRNWCNHIWENYRLLNVEGFEISALSHEDELINLVVHLARNLKDNTANLQQLCDLAFFLNKNQDFMNFDYIDKIMKSMNLWTYYQYLLKTCDMFLGLKISVNFSSLDKNKSIHLIENIINSDSVSRKIESEEWFLKIKTYLNRITFTRKLLKPLLTRGRFLRSIGLHFRY